MTLSEGETYVFTVLALKSIEEGSDQQFFLLEGPYGGKFLLPSLPYRSYGIQIGSHVACRIDKINCSGKIFLEPENPYYKEGNTYLFDVIRVESCALQNGEMAKSALVKDIMGNNHDVIIGDSDLSKKKIYCRINRIKKGKLHLAVAESDESRPNNLTENRWYTFRIEGEHTLFSGKRNLILKAPDGSLHYIAAEDYMHYHLQIGQTVEALVMKRRWNSHYYLEPRHPVYTIGKNYDFEVIAVEQYTRQEDFAEIKIVTVLDTLQKKASLMWQNETLPVVGAKIYCKVIGLKKGRLVISQ